LYDSALSHVLFEIFIEMLNVYKTFTKLCI